MECFDLIDNTLDDPATKEISKAQKHSFFVESNPEGFGVLLHVASSIGPVDLSSDRFGCLKLGRAVHRSRTPPINPFRRGQSVLEAERVTWTTCDCDGHKVGP